MAVLADEASFTAAEVGEIRTPTSDVESVEFAGCRFAGVELQGVVLRRAAFTDCALTGSSLANVRAERSRLLRVDLDELRLTGFGWIDGTLRDVAFRRCRMDLAAFRFSALHTVVFADCNLTRADFTGADLRGARFERCDLTAAQFSHAKMDGAHFAECVLEGVGGVASFAGATVTTSDLVSLARMMAGALGIIIDSPAAGDGS